MLLTDLVTEVHMFLGKMLILAILLKLAKPKPLAPAAGSPAT